MKPARRWSPARVCAAVLALVLALPAAATAQTEPTASGTMRITAKGTGGLALHLPVDVTHDDANYAVSLTGGTFGYVHIAPDECVGEELFGSCQSYYALLNPQSQVYPVYQHAVNDTVRAGRLEIYVVTDGTVTLEMTFKELSGTAEYVADTPIDAHFEALPRNCPESLGDCHFLGHGGATHSVGDRGLVGSFGYAEQAGEPIAPLVRPSETGTISVASCVSPGPREPGGSSDPADHPEGCRFGAAAPASSYMIDYVARTPPGASGFGSFEWDVGASGEVYAGYRAHAFNPVFPDATYYGAFGVWITLGIPA